MVFMDNEVGYHTLQLQGGGCGKWARTYMSLYGYVIYMSHITDFLSLSDTAAVTQIRLYNLHGHVLKILRVLPSGVNPLSMGYGDIDVVRDEFCGFGTWCVRLLEIEYIILLHCPCQLNRPVGIGNGSP
mgnify:CR=1 FL=1